MAKLVLSKKRKARLAVTSQRWRERYRDRIAVDSRKYEHIGLEMFEDWQRENRGTEYNDLFSGVKHDQ